MYLIISLSPDRVRDEGERQAQQAGEHPQRRDRAAHHHIRQPEEGGGRAGKG